MGKLPAPKPSSKAPFKKLFVLKAQVLSSTPNISFKCWGEENGVEEWGTGPGRQI